MSSYKLGKIIFHTSLIIVILVIVVFVVFPLIGGLVLAAAFFISSDIAHQGMKARVNVSYFEQLILNSETLTVVYNGQEFTNLNNGFREYYSSSHEVPVDYSEENNSFKYLNSDSFFVCASDGDYTCKAIYKKDIQSFTLYCVADKYSVFKAANYDQSKFVYVNGAEFPYNSAMNFDNLVSYFVQ